MFSHVLTQTSRKGGGKKSICLLYTASSLSSRSRLIKSTCIPLPRLYGLEPLKNALVRSIVTFSIIKICSNFFDEISVDGEFLPESKVRLSWYYYGRFEFLSTRQTKSSDQEIL